MSKDYKVHSVFVESIDFNLLVLEIPENEIEDKLTHLVREKGQIPKTLYEDFLIATCIANLNQLLSHVSQSVMSKEGFIKTREEVAQSVIDKNPALNPNNIVINRNHVLKIKNKDDKDVKKLIDNKNWNLSYYDEINEYYGNYESPDSITNDINELDNNKNNDILRKASKTVKDINTLEFNIEKRWWGRINQYVTIKIFKEEDARSILQRHFRTKLSFTSYITSICIEDFEALYQTLDDMGITNRVTPPILINELYELCRESNKFLTFDNARLFYKEIDDGSQNDGGFGRGKLKTGMKGSKIPKSNKKSLKFKDVSKENLLSLSERMKVFLIGQDEAVEKISESIQRASVGLKDPVKPIGSFLFAGRTGVGKTLATKVLADTLINNKENLVNIDCSEYSADHEYSKLIGAPAGYIGHENGGFLTNAISKNPFSVVVFDEIEKASHKVHELLLQILEEGRLTDGQGKAVSFKDTIIIMTSNVGVEEIDSIKKTVGFGNVAEITEKKKNIALDSALKKKFKPEFLNRIDNIISFRTLEKEDYMRIIEIELYKLSDNLQTNDTDYKGITLKFDKKVNKYIYKNGIDKDYGARPLKRCIEKEISTPLALRLLKEDIDKDSKILITIENNEAKFDIEPIFEKPPFYMEDEYKIMTVSGGQV